MKRTAKAVLSFVFAAVFILSLLPLKPLAVNPTYSFTASSSSLKVGDTLTVTYSMSYSGGDLETFMTEFDYDENVFEFAGCSDSVRMSDLGGTVRMIIEDTHGTCVTTFKAKAAGTAQFTLKKLESERDFPQSAVLSVTVNSSAPPTPVEPSQPDSPALSSDAKLVSLKVSGAELYPAFNGNVTNYTATVKHSVKKITLSATAAAGARFVGTGTFDLEIGNNSHTITVTAADKKTKKAYTVNIRRMSEAETKAAESGKSDDPLAVKIGGDECKITPDISALGVYEGFTVEKIKRGETEVSVLKDNAGFYTLYYITDANGRGGYYNSSKGDNFERVWCMPVNGKLYIVKEVPREKIPEGYKSAVLKTAVDSVPALQFKNSAAADIFVVYCYFNGVTQYYRYDKLENTFARAPEIGAAAGSISTDAPVREPGMIAGTIAGIIGRFLAMNTVGKAVVVLVLLAALGIIAVILLLIIKLCKKAGGKKVNAIPAQAPDLSDMILISDSGEPLQNADNVESTENAGNTENTETEQ